MITTSFYETAPPGNPPVSATSKFFLKPYWYIHELNDHFIDNINCRHEMYEQLANKRSAFIAVWYVDCLMLQNSGLYSWIQQIICFYFYQFIYSFMLLFVDLRVRASTLRNWYVNAADHSDKIWPQKEIQNSSGNYEVTLAWNSLYMWECRYLHSADSSVKLSRQP